MNDATKLRIRRELAERMGYIVEPVAVEMPGFRGYGLRKPGSDLYAYPSFGSETEDEAWQCVPDPFTDHADCAALVAWLAEQNEESNLEVFSQISNRWIKVPVWQKFLYKLQFLLFQCDFTSPPLDVVMNIMTSPLPVRVLAACAALGIDTSDQ